MHQGNLFVDNKGNIIPVDFGIMGRLNKDNRKFLADIIRLFREIMLKLPTTFSGGFSASKYI